MRAALIAIVLAFVMGWTAQGAKATQPGSFDPAAAVETYLNLVQGEARAKSDAYFEGGYWLDAVEAGIGVAIALFLLFGGVASRLRDWTERVSGFRSIQAFLFALVYFVFVTALSLPFTYYRSFLREHEFDLSNQTAAEWASEFAIATAVNGLLLAILIVVIYAVIRAAPRTWWIWGTGVTIGFLIVVMLLGPVYLAPLFNTYKPMDEGPLKEQILALARANGVPAENVYQFDASRQSKRISANVSGLFGTTRISLNDNLLKRCTEAEVRAVMGHEMGHYALNHIYKALLAFVLIFGVMFALASSMTKGLIAMFGKTWGVRGLSDIASLPVLGLAFGILGYLSTPLVNAITRTQEIEADIYGLNASRDPDGFAAAAMKLSEYRKIDPQWWEEMIFYTHPSGRARVTMAMKWKAEHLNPSFTAQWPHPLSYQQGAVPNANGSPAPAHAPAPPAN